MKFISTQRITVAHRRNRTRLTAQPAKAAFFTASGTGGSGHAVGASANFSYGAGVLTIVLTNTSTFDYGTSNSNKAVPVDVLTGLFFDYNGGFGPSLTFNSAVASAITAGSNPANLKLSSTPGGWDFDQDSSPLSGVTQHYGLGTAGFNIFDGNTSSGGPGHPTNYGIMNSLFVDGESNNPMVGTPYARDSITFSLAVGGAFDPNLLSNIRFQYGTAAE